MTLLISVAKDLAGQGHGNCFCMTYDLLCSLVWTHCSLPKHVVMWQFLHEAINTSGKWWAEKCTDWTGHRVPWFSSQLPSVVMLCKPCDPLLILLALLQYNTGRCRYIWSPNIWPSYGFFDLMSDFGSKHMETSESVLVSKLHFVCIAWIHKCLKPCDGMMHKEIASILIYITGRRSTERLRMYQCSGFGTWQLHSSCGLLFFHHLLSFLAWLWFLVLNISKVSGSWNKPINQLPLVVSPFLSPADIHILADMYSLPGIWKSKLRRFVDGSYVWSPLVEKLGKLWFVMLKMLVFLRASKKSY